MKEGRQNLTFGSCECITRMRPFMSHNINNKFSICVDDDSYG